jgi:hypothetical protein
MSRLRSLVAVLATASVLVAGCGSTTITPAPSVRASGGTASVIPVPVTTEFRVGDNRTVFSLLDPSGQKPAAAPDRTLAIAYRGPNGEAIPSAPQTFIWAVENVNGVYTGKATFPSAGKWIADFTTEAPGSPKVTISFSFDVQQRTVVLSPGDPAPSVATPTLAEAGGNVARISSDAKPVTRFYETSEADAVAARKPFVLIFATPKFCQTATCGPTLDRLKPVATKHPELTFINVEPYKLTESNGALQPVLDAQNQLVPVEATTAFKLQSEPYVFVVGSDGKIHSSFELVFSPDEIEAAIQAVE